MLPAPMALLLWLILPRVCYNTLPQPAAPMALLLFPCCCFLGCIPVVGSSLAVSLEAVAPMVLLLWLLLP